MHSGQKCCYRILQINRSSTDKDIKESFIRLAKLYHPDINKKESAPQEFREIHEAYTALKDVQARRLYEESLRAVTHEQQPFNSTSAGAPCMYFV